MLRERHTDEDVIEDLVLVMIDGNVLSIIIGRTQEAVPGVWWVEPVAYDDRRVRDLANLTITITVKLFCDVQANIAAVLSRLIEDLDANYHVLVLRLGILVRNSVKNL